MQCVFWPTLGVWGSDLAVCAYICTLPALTVAGNGKPVCVRMILAGPNCSWQWKASVCVRMILAGPNFTWQWKANVCVRIILAGPDCSWQWKANVCVRMILAGPNCTWQLYTGLEF